MSRFLLLLSTCFILQGCTVITQSYFRNFTNEPVEIWYLAEEQHLQSSSERRHFFYSKSIEPINGRLWKRMKDSLPITYKDNAMILTIPANATMRFPYGIYYGKAYIKQASRSDTVWLNAVDRSIDLRHKVTGFPIRPVLYYDHY